MLEVNSKAMDFSHPALAKATKPIRPGKGARRRFEQSSASHQPVGSSSWSVKSLQVPNSLDSCDARAGARVASQLPWLATLWFNSAMIGFFSEGHGETRGVCTVLRGKKWRRGAEFSAVIGGFGFCRHPEEHLLSPRPYRLSWTARRPSASD